MSSLDDFDNEYDEVVKDYSSYDYIESVHDVFENVNNELYRVLNEAVKHWTAATMSSSDRKDNSFVNSNIKSLNKMDQQQNSRISVSKKLKKTALASQC